MIARLCYHVSGTSASWTGIWLIQPRYPAMETHCWELAWDQMTSDLLELGFPAESLCLVLQSRGMDLVEILSFLFQLSFSTLGRVSAPLLVLSLAEPGFWPCCWIMALLFQDYSVEGMSASLLTFLQHLREFGLVFQRKVRSTTRSTLVDPAHTSGLGEELGAVMR